MTDLERWGPAVVEARQQNCMACCNAQVASGLQFLAMLTCQIKCGEGGKLQGQCGTSRVKGGKECGKGKGKLGKG